MTRGLNLRRLITLFMGDHVAFNAPFRTQAWPDTFSSNDSWSFFWPDSVGGFNLFVGFFKFVPNLSKIFLCIFFQFLQWFLMSYFKLLKFLLHLLQSTRRTIRQALTSNAKSRVNRSQHSAQRSNLVCTDGTISYQSPSRRKVHARKEAPMPRVMARIKYSLDSRRGPV